jgi:hypothetical protein
MFLISITLLVLLMCVRVDALTGKQLMVWVIVFLSNMLIVYFTRPRSNRININDKKF